MRGDVRLRCSRSRQDFGRTGERAANLPEFLRIRLPFPLSAYRSGRKVETLVKFWDLTPHMELLSNREENEAYLAAKPGKQYVLYFTDGGSVNLDMTACNGDLGLKWIDISTGEWAGAGELVGGGAVPVNAPAKGPWVAVIVAAGGDG